MKKDITVGVVVIGDIGRSPRMQYHAYSLQREGYNVKLLGYNESNCNNELLKGIQLINVEQPPDSLKNYPQLLQFIFKTLWIAFFLFLTLFRNGRFQILLVQNPPAIPSMAVCWFYCLIFQAKFIVDWHNFAYSILSMNIGPRHLLVKISRIFEQCFGRLADENICVTRAMKDYLKKNWNIEAVTLYDKPGPTMKPSISSEEKVELFERLSNSYSEFKNMSNSKALLISSTSWTEDEDFSILLDALKNYDQIESNEFPHIICVITGKGPLKFHYQSKIKENQWKKVSIVTPWLEAEDYPRLLACADLGICLHTSSSGLDLPMKIVDMFGCCLPVCAYDYPCLSELLRHNENGMVFEDSQQLFMEIKAWFKNFPEEQQQHIEFRQEILKFLKTDWHSNWVKNALPLFIN